MKKELSIHFIFHTLDYYCFITDYNIRQPPSCKSVAAMHSYRFLEISLTCHIIQRQADSCLMEPDLPHDIVKELHDGDPTIRVHLQEFGEH